MSKCIIVEVNIDSKYKTLADRKQPFFRWAKKNAPDLYYSLLVGQTEFKDKWLAKIETIRVAKRVPDEYVTPQSMSKEEMLAIAEREEVLMKSMDSNLPF